ncbi:MAG TPA: hypothetical protein VMW56_24350 [Candidatus Margulisiibacteriota bacterium]|nr:hypothetical protein [Candidatus Margulisiibacteriota bacterium]
MDASGALTPVTKEPHRDVYPLRQRMTTMHPRLRNHLALLCLVLLLAGCASEALVSIDAAKLVPRADQTPQRVQVRVTDIRHDANLERTAYGGTPMGRITLQPPVQELVTLLVKATADEVLAHHGITEPQTVLYGIRTFDIATPATLFYWDVNAKIELVLRVRGQDRTVSGWATERTFVWPSEEMIAARAERFRTRRAMPLPAKRTLVATPTRVTHSARRPRTRAPFCVGCTGWQRRRESAAGNPSCAAPSHERSWIASKGNPKTGPADRLDYRPVAGGRNGMGLQVQHACESAFSAAIR